MDCDLLNCSKFKDKIYPKFKHAKDHRIVHPLSAKNITDRSAVISVNHVPRYFVRFCIAKIHNGHGLITINEGYEIGVD